MHPALRTPLCALLGIDYPIVQSGMRRVAGPDLVAAVSKAGGLGILAGLMTTADDLRQQIAQVRALTDRPFGVNLWFHERVEHPARPEDVVEEDVAWAQQELNGFREKLGAPPRYDPPGPMPELLDAAFEVLVEERVPVFSAGLGNPGRARIERCHARGIRVIAMACHVHDARILEADGVDAVVAQGSEAGGHRSNWVLADRVTAAGVGSFVLLPELVDALRIPVIAAGGVADGRGLVAALALGAAGVLLGTRFVATRESLSPGFFKDAILQHTSNATQVTNVFTGLYARGIQNRFIADYEDSGAPVLPPMLHTQTAEDVFALSARANSPDYFPMLAGQSLGLINDIVRAGDVVRTLMDEAEQTLARLSPPSRVAASSPGSLNH